jgi:hypothetical protein
LEYLTDKDIEVAAANGIPEKNLKYRVYWLGWSKKRAMTQPCKTPEKLWPKYKKQCEETGICSSTFFRRIKVMGMSPEMAATYPKNEHNKKNCIVSKEVQERAAKYGVNRSTLMARVHNYGWPLEKAITTPPLKQYRRKG